MLDNKILQNYKGAQESNIIPNESANVLNHLIIMQLFDKFFTVILFTYLWGQDEILLSIDITRVNYAGAAAHTAPIMVPPLARTRSMREAVSLVYNVSFHLSILIQTCNNY